MVVYGSDYLLGLSTFAPDAFAARDQAWAAGDEPRFWALNDVLQYLGQLAFRDPVPGYRHDAAMFLALRGRIGCDRTHPTSPDPPRRPTGRCSPTSPPASTPSSRSSSPRFGARYVRSAVCTRRPIGTVGGQGVALEDDAFEEVRGAVAIGSHSKPGPPRDRRRGGRETVGGEARRSRPRSTPAV